MNFQFQRVLGAPFNWQEYQPTTVDCVIAGIVTKPSAIYVEVPIPKAEWEQDGGAATLEGVSAAIEAALETEGARGR